jgi:ABC-2 type transport system ATP-binding protein
MLGFLGPNGAGKTTAMRAVVGLVELDASASRRPAANRSSRSQRLQEHPQPRLRHPKNGGMR